MVVTIAWQGGDHWGNHEEKFITIIKLSRESVICAMLFRFIIMNHKQKSSWSASVPIEIEIDKKV